MTYTTRGYSVSHQKDEGFTLHLQETSPIRDAILTLSDNLCALTGHRFCHTLFAKTDNWAYKATKTTLIIPITREQADILSEPDTWTWLDEDVHEV